jgi:hypothetical protein
VAVEKRNISGVQRYNWVSERKVGKGKRVDVYLEVRKRRGHLVFE